MKPGSEWPSKKTADEISCKGNPSAHSAIFLSCPFQVSIKLSDYKANIRLELPVCQAIHVLIKNSRSSNRHLLAINPLSGHLNCFL